VILLRVAACADVLDFEDTLHAYRGHLVKATGEKHH
jgi:hypothetical protein